MYKTFCYSSGKYRKMLVLLGCVIIMDGSVKVKASIAGVVKRRKQEEGRGMIPKRKTGSLRSARHASISVSEIPNNWKCT